MWPGQCKGKAHRREHLGHGGRRVLVSRKWSGKSLADHKHERRAWVLATLGETSVGQGRYLWAPAAPTTPTYPHSRTDCCTLSRDAPNGGKPSTTPKHKPPAIFRQPEPERRKADGLWADAVLKTHRVISRALRIAHRRGRVARNVAQLVDPPRYKRGEVDPLDATEARSILEVAKSHRNTARWTVAFALGLRQGEALGLQWEYVDLEAGTPRVAWELPRLTWLHGCDDPERCGLHLKLLMRARRCPKRRGGGLVLRSPNPRLQSVRSRFLIRCSLSCEPTMRRNVRNARRPVPPGPVGKVDTWFSLVRMGGPIDPRRDWAEWKDLLQAAGVRDARLHDARHTAATLLLQQDVHPRVVMGILGHAEISLTLGTYSHVVPELSKQAARSMEQALWT